MVVAQAATPTHQLPKPNQPLARQKPLDVPLHALEAHSPATLALQMIEQRSQPIELARTARARTTIHFIRTDMRWTIDMLVQRCQGIETAVAEIAFIAVPVPRRSRRRGRCRSDVGIRIREQFLSDEMVRVALADLSEDGGMIEIAGFGTGARFQVRGQACCGGECALAEGAGERGAAVEIGVQVLWEVRDYHWYGLCVGWNVKEVSG
jgi:hypothetical protein